MDQPPTITLRSATADDASHLERLAQLDSASVPRGVLLLAAIEGRPVAAIAIESGVVIADPFTRTAGVVELLRARADRLRGADSGRLVPVASRGDRLRRVRRTFAA